MQETKEFLAADGAIIQVEVNSAEGNEAGALCIHGFTSTNRTHMWYNAAQLWPKKGLDTWRIALYPGGQGRQMKSLTWTENMGDITLVLNEMSRVYKKLFIVGHSLGGTMALEATDERVTAVALWDPPYNVKLEERVGEELHPDFYTLDWGNTLLVSKSHAKEISAAARYEKPLKQAPTLLIRASNNAEGWPTELIPVKKVVVKESDHSFNKEGNEKKLFSLTLNFFKKYMGNFEVA